MEDFTAGHGRARRGARRSLSCAALLAVCLVACSSTDPARKPAELETINASLPVHVAWRVAVGQARGAPLAPAVVENAIYAAAADGVVVRVAPDSGKVIWRVETGSPISSGVGADGFTVAVATQRGDVIVIDSDGKPRWKAQVSSDVFVPPLVGRGVVIVRSTDHRLVAFDSDTGKRLWVYQRAVPPLTLRALSDMEFVGDNVLVAYPGGRLVALALANGALRWEAVVSEPKGTTEVERLADVVGAIATDAHDACGASYQGRIMCADANSGTLRWSREMPAGAGVGFDARRVFGVDERSTVIANGRDSGASLWRNEKLRNRALTSPLVLSSAVVVGDLDGYVHFLALDDGALVARIATDNSPIVATPRALGGGALVQTQTGTLALLRIDR